MPGFDDTFRLSTKDKTFLDSFVSAINEKEKKMGSVSIMQEGEEYSAEVVGDLFFGNSLSHSRAMTSLLKKCLESREDTVFTGHYDLHCYSCKDEASFEYQYEGSLLTVRGSYEDSDDDLSLGDDCCEGKVFFISGKLWIFLDEDEFKEYIESFGGIVTDQLSAETDYIICNKRSLTPELEKEAEVGNISIITEKDFIRCFGDAGEFEDEGISLSSRYMVGTYTKNETGWEEQITLYESEEEYWDTISDEDWVDEDE